MNIDRQFPPSSPLLNAELENEDVSKHDIFDALAKANAKQQLVQPSRKEKDDAYLTPDPSSSLGDVTMNSDTGNVSVHSENDDSMTKISANSSPTKLVSNKKFKTNENTTIDVSQPLNAKNFHNVIHVPLNGDTFKIGRSGISCSFKLNSKNKLISRVHADIKYEQESNMIILRCLGFNGLNITIPKSISAHPISDKYYMINVNEKDSSDGYETSSEVESERILSRTSAYTNFYMLKGESIKMPMIKGTVLDFRGDLALLDYEKPNLDLIAKKKQQAKVSNIIEPPSDIHAKRPRKLSTEDLLRIVEQKKLQFSTHPTLAELRDKKQNVGARPIEKEHLANTIIYKRPSPISFESSSEQLFEVNEMEYPVKPVRETIEYPIIQATASPVKIAKPISRSALGDITKHVVNKVEKLDKAKIDKIEKMKKPSASKPEITHTAKSITIEKPEVELKQDIIRQITSSPSPTPHKEKTPEPTSSDEHDHDSEHKKKGRPKKVKQTEEDILRSMPREEIDKVLSTIPELDDISNLVTNHIAYSRVLQTPFSSIIELNSIKKHNLSKLQLRCLLIHSIDCIGVIFRQGKDAAGKQLDEEYYYVPEKDSDRQRVQLVEELKGSSSHLRSCRKTHKQYFWKKPKI